MASWFSRLLKPSEPAAASSLLARQLASYPPCPAAHPGPASRWTAAQAADNFGRFMQQREQRLAALQGLLAGHGIQFEAVLDHGDTGPLLAALHQWALACWPGVRGTARPDRQAWLASSRSGPQIMHALLLDLAILLGELIVRRRSGIRWGVDNSDSSRDDDMPTWQRVVLLVDRQALAREPQVLDVEAVVFGRWMRIDSPTERLVDDWAGLLQDAVAGRYEAA
ncbi:hypothetical protein [Aquabacterium sp. OR-4]|uniref:hypothetical protein n=1 Tax=Aquabacterium sp. OR-4 TaxID=2978127 RepID=UPI0021B2DE50|nr:hypothetical protein [Aquabacterium sp. OR-4]MDT7836063.1 hypothetical protein [Aquabacterium sp. OR-4]